MATQAYANSINSAYAVAKPITKRRRNFKKSARHAAVSAYQNGMSPSKIAQDFGVNPSTFFYWLKAAGVQARTTYKTAKSVEATFVVTRKADTLDGLLDTEINRLAGVYNQQLDAAAETKRRIEKLNAAKAALA